VEFTSFSLAAVKKIRILPKKTISASTIIAKNLISTDTILKTIMLKLR
jgi:hypothetical protein